MGFDSPESTMAKLRKFCAYRRLERPYTRISKFRAKSFVRTRPNSKIVRYDMGDPAKNFEYEISLISDENVQIRHNALESGRLTCLRTLEKALGKKGFHFKIRVYPHHILRENPLASGAGADRMSTGMKMSFGKVIGIAAQVRKGQKLFSVKLDKSALPVGRTAIKKISHKLPCSCRFSEQKVELPAE